MPAPGVILEVCIDRDVKQEAGSRPILDTRDQGHPNEEEML
jgi:hypothetical protein